MILKSADDDFGSTGASAINERDHRIVAGVFAGSGQKLTRIALMASLDGQDDALIQKNIGHLDRLVQQPPTIIA